MCDEGENHEKDKYFSQLLRHYCFMRIGIGSLRNCDKRSPPTATPLPPTLEATIPTDTSTPLPTSTPSATNIPVQPVYVNAFCTIIGKDKTTRVSIGTPVNIIWGWNAKTESQINDFLENNTTIVTLDGKVIKGTQTGGIMKVESRNDLEVVWVSEVGILDPGQHTITFDQKSRRKLRMGITSMVRARKTKQFTMSA